MKKITFTLLALIMALCCVFGLVACNNDGDTTVAVTSVTLNKTELTLEIGGEETLTATVKPDDATNKTVSWSVSPAGVVAVENGKVTAIAAGSATVTATADGKSATCAVTVNSTALGGTVNGMLSETAKDSAEEAAAAFIAEQFAGKSEFVSYTKAADLTTAEIAALDLGAYKASDVERGEKGTVSYKETSASGIALFAAEENETAEIYILVIGGKYHYYVLPAQGGEVTAAQWESILGSETTFTVVMYRDNSYTTTIKVDGAKRGYVSSQGNQIFVKEGENYFDYSFDKGVWTKSDLTEADYNGFSGIYAQLLSFFKDDYSAFTYENGKYACASIDKTTAMNGVLENIEIVFENGAVVSVVFESNDTFSLKFEITDIGETTIELPTDYVDNTSSAQGNEVTASQWEQILGSATSYACEASIDDEVVVIVEADGTKLSYEQSDNIGIYVKDGNEYFIYEADGSNWIRTTVDEEYVAIFIEGAKILQLFKNDYSKFTYSNDKYTCNSLINDSFIELFENIIPLESIDNIEITFTNGAVTSIAFDLVFDYDGLTVHCEFTAIGSTTIELPTDYVDNTKSEKLELTVDELKTLLANVEDKNYTKQTRIQGDARDTFVYGTEDWEHATSGAIILTVEILDMLSATTEASNIKIFMENDTYVLELDVETNGNLLHEVLTYDSDFYIQRMLLQMYQEDELIDVSDIGFEWGYATADELASVS